MLQNQGKSGLAGLFGAPDSKVKLLWLWHAISQMNTLFAEAAEFFLVLFEDFLRHEFLSKLCLWKWTPSIPLDDDFSFSFPLPSIFWFWGVGKADLFTYKKSNWISWVPLVSFDLSLRHTVAWKHNKKIVFRHRGTFQPVTIQTVCQCC